MAKFKYVIGIHGFKQSGKDATAEIARQCLLNNFDSLSERYAFGDELKLECSEQTGVPLEFFYLANKKELVRNLMTAWGDLRRNTELGGYVDYWIERVTNQVDQMTSDYEGFFVTDIRYDNEAEWIFKQDAEIKRIIKV